MKNILVAIMVSALAAVAVFYALPAKTPAAAAATDSVYSRVMASKTIRCGYTPYSVGLRKTDDGKLEGIYKDLLEEMGTLLDMKIWWVEEVGWGEQIAGLDSGRYDLVCSPANMTGPRAMGADFSPPLFYSPVYVWSRSNDVRFSGDDKSNLVRANMADIAFATIDGEQVEAQARYYFPKAKQVSAPSSAPFATMFINVATNKADLTIAEPAAVREFVASNPDYKLKEVNPTDPLILAVNIMLMKKGDAEFKALISNAVNILNANGVLNRIMDKWEPFPGAYVRTPRVQ